MSNSPVRFAILGSGMIAEYHRQALEEIGAAEAKLVAIGHHDPRRFSSISDQFGVPCRDVDEVLADTDIDAVCICTPSGEHATQAIRAARAGKHVLVEKPMALSEADADAMIDECERAGVQFGVVLQRRVEPAGRWVYQAIDSGALGELTLGAVTLPYFRPQSYYEQADWRGTWALDGGGVLMNQGIHLLDLLLWYMGDPVAVQAEARTLHRDIEVEDTLAAILTFPNGAMATITATTTASPGFPHRVEVYGTAGSVQVEGESVVRWETTVPETIDLPPPGDGTAGQAGSSADPRGISITGHVTILQDFIQAIRTGAPLRIDGREGRRSVAAIRSVYRAAAVLPSDSA